jgi:hypothetical protein
MTSKDFIQQEVEKTLQSLDGVKRAEANPYLFTRIKARMQQNTPWERISSFVSRPVIAFATLLLIMAINAFVVLSSDSNEGNGTEIAVTDIAEDYKLATSTNYEYETVEDK